MAERGVEVFHTTILRWVQYRAVDKQGLTVDFLLSEQRAIAAAKQFFTRAIEQHGPPERITLGGYPATQTAVAELEKESILPSATQVWMSKDLNNLSEQDDRRVKQRMYPMLGFKKLANAAITISGGMELAQKIRKGSSASRR